MKNLTIAQAVQITSFSRHSIRRALEVGEVRHYKPSSQSFRIPETALDLWVRSKLRGGK